MRRELSIRRNGRPVWSVADFDSFFDQAFGQPFSILENAPAFNHEDNWFSPQVDVEENDQAFLLSVDVPGMKQDEIKIDVSDNTLTVSGERKRDEKYTSDSGFHRVERRYGKFQRQFTLPTSIDAAKIEANLEDGVLQIALPKTEAEKPRTIQVQSGRQGMFSKFLNNKSSSGTEVRGQ